MRDPSIVPMKHLFKKTGVFLSLVFLGFSFRAVAAEDFQNDFNAANQAYNEGQFARARDLYTSIEQQGHYSAALFYNLGNTEYRLKKQGAAILNYERALALSPGQPEAQANLTRLRDQTGAKVAPKAWQDKLIANFDINAYAWISVVAGWVLVFALTVLILKLVPGRGLAGFAVVCSGCILAYGLFATVRLAQNQSLAVVTAEKTEARLAPADNSTMAGTLPAGSRVWVLERRGPWTYCKLPDQVRAWIPSDTIENVSLQKS